MSVNRKWLVLTGAMALGAGAVGLTGNLAAQAQSVGPAVQLTPAASASATPGLAPMRTALASADDVVSADPATPQNADPASAASPASPNSPDSPASPASPNSPDSPASPDGPASPDSPASADSPESAD